MSNIISHHFNEIAPRYDTYKTRNALYYTTLKNAVAAHITKSKPTICDIGCGTGSVLAFLNPNRGIGVDVSNKMVKLARTKFAFHKQLHFQVHNIETRPLSGNFDYLLFNDVIEHIINKPAAIANISRSMKPNTTLILSMANPFWEPLLMLLEHVHLKMPEGPHTRITERELIHLLEENNLFVLQKKVYLPSISLKFLANFGLIFVYVIRKKNRQR